MKPIHNSAETVVLVCDELRSLTRMSHDEIEKRRYEQREPGLREWEMVQTVSREEGREQGREEGREQGREQGRREELIRVIQFCQDVLRRPVVQTSELQTLSLTELQNQASVLQGEVRNR